MSISLDGCYAGPMDPATPQDAAGWMEGPEAGLLEQLELHIAPVVPDRRGDLHACRASSATAPARTTSRMGPCASCRTWVGDDPNAATNLRFRTTYEH
jgi:hypothetical protein